MPLRDYKFKPDYNKTDDDIAEAFYLPAMGCSCKYDRISGYFGSTIYIIAWEALQSFVDNGGKIRLICSPIISDTDKNAMCEGYTGRNDSAIKAELEQELDTLFASEDTEKPARVLACLIAEEIMDIKIAVPQSGTDPDLRRLFHDKVGIFTDGNGDSVGFRGSMNETFNGLSDDGNLESIDVFPSWEDKRDADRVKRASSYFERLWNRTEPNIAVYDVPDAIRKDLINKANGYNWKDLLKEITVTESKSKKWKSDKRPSGKKPRKHQITALENWAANGHRGILEHATGSGKTYTAICAIRDALNRGKAALVLVPSKELLHQWKTEISENIPDISIRFLLCGDGNDLWKTDNTLNMWTRPISGVNKVTIAIMDTAYSNQFVEGVSSGEHLLLVADEVHRIGSPSRRNILKIDAGERLGLSATPIRYGDPEGTKAIFNYFGGIVQPVFTLHDAIKAGVLTKYYYFPQKVHLTLDEQEQWNEITREINKIIAASLSSGDMSIKDALHGNSRLQMKLIARARIIKQAEGKLKLAMDVIHNHYEIGQKWIIYCDNQSQLSTILRQLVEEGYDAYEYHSGMAGDRTQTLNVFQHNGGILVSIKCLDEGVDIPSTTHALILASSKNPREFIQRRGRILRRSPGKFYATLYDAIVVPETGLIENDRSSSIIENELSRAIQFGEWAENPTCVADLKMIAIAYGIDYKKVENGGFEDDSKEES